MPPSSLFLGPHSPTLYFLYFLGPESAPRKEDSEASFITDAPKTTVLCAFLGAGDGTRTRDSLLGKQVLYQLSYPRVVPSSIRRVESTVYCCGRPLVL